MAEDAYIARQLDRYRGDSHATQQFLAGIAQSPNYTAAQRQAAAARLRSQT